MAWGLERFISSLTDNYVLPANLVTSRRSSFGLQPDILMCFSTTDLQHEYKEEKIDKFLQEEK